MSARRFEVLLQKQMDECVTGLLTKTTTDPDIAKLQGRHAAIVQALRDFRDAIHADDEEMT